MSGWNTSERWVSLIYHLAPESLSFLPYKMGAVITPRDQLSDSLWDQIAACVNRPHGWPFLFLPLAWEQGHGSLPFLVPRTNLKAGSLDKHMQMNPGAQERDQEVTGPLWLRQAYPWTKGTACQHGPKPRPRHQGNWRHGEKWQISVVNFFEMEYELRHNFLFTIRKH